MPVTKPCEHCGQLFTKPASMAGRFCSRDCWKADHASRREDRTCPQCGTTFVVTPGDLRKGGGKYCSARCRDDGGRVYPTLTCPVCEKQFNPIHSYDVYCSRECGGIGRRTQVERSCLRCGKTFTEKPSRVADGRGFYCSRTCATPGPLERICEKCGGAFTAQPNELSRGWGRFCSNDCRRTGSHVPCGTCGVQVWQLASKKDNGYKTYCSTACRGVGMRDRTVFNCAHCGKATERAASTVANPDESYCSKDCWYQAYKDDPVRMDRVRQMQRNHITTKGPTRPELQLYDLMDEIFGEEGWDCQYRVFDRWTADAAVAELKLIVQADGDYWHGLDPATHDNPTIAHNRANDQRLTAFVAKAGWTMLRLWEFELAKQREDCRRRIKAAADEASTHLRSDVDRGAAH